MNIQFLWMFVQKKSRELLSIRLEERIRSFKRSAAMFVCFGRKRKAKNIQTKKQLCCSIGILAYSINLWHC